MEFAVVALIAASLLLIPFYPGVGLALSISTYSFRGALPMPGALAAITAAAPILYMIFNLRSARNVRLGVADGLYFFYVASVLLLTPFTTPGQAPFGNMIQDMGANTGFYLVGRFYVFFEPTSGRFGLRTSTQVMLGFSLLALAYVASTATTQILDRTVFEDLTPVGLAQALNLWICTCVGILLSWFFNWGSSKGVGSEASHSGVNPAVVMIAAASLGYSVYLLIQNGTRGALVGSIFAALCLTVLPIFKQRQLTRIVTVFTGIILLLFLLASLKPLIESQIFGDGRFQRLLEGIGSTFGYETVGSFDPSMEERRLLRANAWQLFGDHPIFGCGYLCTAMAGGYPHNILLETLAEGGVVNFILLSGFMAAATVNAIKVAAEKRDANAVVATTAFFSLMFIFEISYSVQFARNLFFFSGVCIALAHGPLSSARAEHRSRGRRPRPVHGHLGPMVDSAAGSGAHAGTRSARMFRSMPADRGARPLRADKPEGQAPR